MKIITKFEPVTFTVCALLYMSELQKIVLLMESRKCFFILMLAKVLIHFMVRIYSSMLVQSESFVDALILFPYF